jgi:hypothetical protein
VFGMHASLSTVCWMCFSMHPAPLNDIQSLCETPGYQNDMCRRRRLSPRGDLRPPSRAIQPRCRRVSLDGVPTAIDVHRLVGFGMVNLG